MDLPYEKKRNLLEQAFLAAVDAVRPKHFMKDVAKDVQHAIGSSAVYLLAIGKAAGQMASAYLDEGGAVKEGLVILPKGVDADLPDNFEICHAAHPVPDEDSLAAAQKAMQFAQALGADDVLVVLISGGGSSLACAPAPGLSLADKMAVNQALLASGAPIQEMNIVRKHLSAIKGGRLAAAAYPARLLGYALSDVPGDDAASIASGPTVGDESTAAEARAIIDKYGIVLSDEMVKWLDNPACESPFPDDKALTKASMKIIASANHALQAASDMLKQAGYEPVMLGDAFQIPSREMADFLIEKAEAAAPGTALISGGETSVEVTGNGCGGRNAETAHALALYQKEGICGIVGDSDGIDGAAKVAASFFSPTSVKEAESLSLDAAAMLADNDSHSFFKALSSQLITGPTETNVNDIRILLIGEPPV